MGHFTISRFTRFTAALALSLGLFVFASPLLAVGGSQDAGNYTIHYNAIPTARLTPQVASAYGILRSKTRGLLNVAVIRQQEGTTGEPVSADIIVHASNLTGQSKQINLREITEEQAIYTIGEFGISHGETVVFDIYVTPPGAEKTHHIHFQKQFFIS